VTAQLDGRMQAGRGEPDLAKERVLDGNGRLAFSVDAAGSLVQYGYDANGNLVRQTGYATAIASDVPHTYAGISARLPAASAEDRVTVNAYDARNRLTRQLDGTGALTVFSYDGNGNLVARDAYATPVAAIDATPAASAADRRERMVYDAAGRMVDRPA
jgi:YD repeat-containing protein